MLGLLFLGIIQEIIRKSRFVKSGSSFYSIVGIKFFETNVNSGCNSPFFFLKMFLLYCIFYHICSANVRKRMMLPRSLGYRLEYLSCIFCLPAILRNSAITFTSYTAMLSMDRYSKNVL